MDIPCHASDYLDRAETLRAKDDQSSLIYSALELRCGIEARMKEYASYAVGISKSRAKDWKITKLGKTLESAFGRGDTMLVILVETNDRKKGQFIYAPVTAQLQTIGKKCGDYLHAMPADLVADKTHWSKLKAILHEGCGLLRLACSGEIMRPSLDAGLHIVLPPADPRIEIVQAWQSGAEVRVSMLDITSAGPITYYPAGEA